jgi:5-methylthioadenosine/S-adenosylhomocysteine deaminase
LTTAQWQSRARALSAAIRAQRSSKLSTRTSAKLQRGGDFARLRQRAFAFGTDGFRGFLEQEENDFPAWLRKLTLTRAEHLTPDDIRVSATCGAIEAARAGVTCVGDASDSGMASLAALRDVGLRGTVYQEAFGPDPNSAREQFDKLQEKIAALRASESNLARVGVSPHAPYTVSAKLQLIAAYAEAERLPLMMHAAESIAENLLMRENRGTLPKV